jgi:hypothetical protein
VLIAGHGAGMVTDRAAWDTRNRRVADNRGTRWTNDPRGV